MNKILDKKFNKKLVLILSLVIVVLLFMPYVWSHWFSIYYQEISIKHTLTSQLDDLKIPLKAMGFDITKVKAYCERKGDDISYCDASINSYVVVHNSSVDLNDYAAQLSDLLVKNGWHQREDYPTKSWFDKISQQVDYQPDQLNSKKIGSIDCTLDFFSSFSKPQPAAITLNAICSKGTSATILD